MSKYDSLARYLANADGRELRISFASIEKILGFPLPPSKRYQAWWSNNPSNNVMTKAWLAAGYRTGQVDVAGEKVTFVRAASGFSETQQSSMSSGKAKVSAERTRHPAWGVWKGRVTVLPDVDYTEPADPDWGKVYE